jgi:hypothetical protein
LTFLIFLPSDYDMSSIRVDFHIRPPASYKESDSGLETTSSYEFALPATTATAPSNGNVEQGPTSPLRLALEEARLKSNEVLTAWKEEIGESEKQRENQVAEELKREAETKRLAGGDDEDESAEDE